MKSSTNRSFSNTIRLFIMAVLAALFTLSTGQTALAQEAYRAPVNLGMAAPFAVLTKTGITNVPASDITGNMGVSPIASTGITGFSLVADSTNTFSRSSQVTGKIYAANYAAPTPANLTTAISNMETAYTDAAGRTLPDFTELYAGNLSGRTLAPGLYKWSSGVLINSGVTLSGPEGSVWIFQISGDLTVGSGAKVVLSGGALPNNVFWQVAGGTGVEIGTTAHVEGTILAKKAIHLRTGASLNGRALSQTAVTLAKNTVVIPSAAQSKNFNSIASLDGFVIESSETSNIGGSANSDSVTLAIGDNDANKQFKGILDFNTDRIPDTAVITSATLSIMQQGIAGTNPFTTHGRLLVDIRKPYFGTTISLLASDFQANANEPAVIAFNSTPMAGWYSANLNATGLSRIDRTGTTQFRLRFALDDNNDNATDLIRFYSGDATISARPQLVIRYYVP